jgi:hypothetical protein
MFNHRSIFSFLFTATLLAASACTTDFDDPISVEDEQLEQPEEFEAGTLYVCSPEGEACMATEFELAGSEVDHQTPQAGPVCPDTCNSWTHLGGCYITQPNGTKTVANKCMRRCNDCVDQWIEYHCTMTPCLLLN